MNWLLLLGVGLLLFFAFGLPRLAFSAIDEAREWYRKGALLIDVRTPGEFENGSAQGAINIPLAQIRNDIKESQPDPEQALLLFCRSGARSGTAAKQLKEMGYQRILNVGTVQRAKKVVAP